MAIRQKRRNRLVIIGVAGAVLASAVALVTVALNDQIVFFKSPSDIAAEGLEPGVRVRIGGLVKEGSCITDGTISTFVVTDFDADVEVQHTGILPDLFREGQGVVLTGARDVSGTFVAQEVLAKHDENYIPVEVAEAMKDKGVWQTENPPSVGGEKCSPKLAQLDNRS